MRMHPEFAGDIKDIVPGAIVSFKYAGNYGTGAPINPTIYCVRKDITSWRELVANQHIAKPKTGTMRVVLLLVKKK